MNTIVTRFALAAVLSCVATPSLMGQDAAKRASPLEAVISVQYTGGTLAGFLDLVRKEYPDANIVASPAAKEVEMPELKIKNATLFNALRSVALIAPADYQVTVDLQQSAAQPVYGVRVRPIRQQVAGMPSGSATASVHVFSLKNMTDALPGMSNEKSLTIQSETILMAIDTGLGVGDDKSRAAVRYHKASGLLFVRGTADQLMLVRSTVQSLENDLSNRRNLARLAAQLRRGSPRKK